MKLTGPRCFVFGVLIFPILSLIGSATLEILEFQLGWLTYSPFNRLEWLLFEGITYSVMGAILSIVSAIVITLWREGNAAIARGFCFCCGIAGLGFLAGFILTSDFAYPMSALNFCLWPALWCVFLIFVAIFARGTSWVR